MEGLVVGLVMTSFLAGYIFLLLAAVIMALGKDQGDFFFWVKTALISPTLGTLLWLGYKFLCGT